jgi:hypothetical protein
MAGPVRDGWRRSHGATPHARCAESSSVATRHAAIPDREVM